MTDFLQPARACVVPFNTTVAESTARRIATFQNRATSLND